MSRHTTLGSLLAMGLLFASCDAAESPTDAGVDAGPLARGAVAVFDPPATGSLDFHDVPFPHDLHLGSDGTVDIGGVPGGNDAMADALGELNERTGFCRTCVISFPLQGPLEPSSVPPDRLGSETASGADPVVLIRADGTGPFIPLTVDYSPLDAALIVRPPYGIVLEPRVGYVAAVTDAVLAQDGTPLAASEVFAAIRDELGGDERADRARPIVEPALEALAARGVPRERVVSLAAFTTEDDAFLLRQLAAVSAAAPAPSGDVSAVLRDEDGDITALMGNPSEDRPGIDIAPADGVGEAAIVHDAIELIVLGTFESPRVVEGAGTEIGALRRDDAGAPARGPTPEAVPYLLVIPRGADLGSLPVVVAHHGFPSTKRFGIRVANTFARMGMALLAYDAFQMGARARTAKDELNEFRILEEPDGIHEAGEGDVALRVTGIDDANGLLPQRTLGGASQMVVDAASAVRFLREGDVSALRTADPLLSGLAFDPGQVYWIGQSFGGTAGMSALPIIEGVQAAALVVGTPDALEHACVGPVNRTAFGPLIASAVGAVGTFDEVERHLCMHPWLNLARWVVAPVSPQNTLRYLLDEPLHEGEPPDLLWVYSVFDELLGITGEHVLGVAGVPARGRSFVVSLPEATLPLSANRVTPNGTITAAGFIYESDHSLIRARDAFVYYEEPFLPPFERLESARAIANPIEEVHRQITVFFETRRDTGRAELINPFD